MQNFIFYLTGILMILAAARAVTTPYIFRAALYLAATLALTAVQYLLLNAEFIAVVQVLVYVGAVIILIVFAVMLTSNLGEGNVAQSNRYALPAALLCLGLGWALIKLLREYDWSKVATAVPAATEAAPASPGQAYNHIQAVGHALLDTTQGYLMPFEIIGLLLFTALVGAVLIARKDPGQ